MAAPAANATPKKVSKFSVAKAATPQGAKRNVAETVVKGAAPEVPKASKVICVPPPSLRMDGHLLVLDYCVWGGQVIITDTARPQQQTPRRLPASAPVKVCLFKVTAWGWLHIAHHAEAPRNAARTTTFYHQPG